MEDSKVNMYLSMNADKFNPQDLVVVKDRLLHMSDDQFIMLQSITLQSPSMILIIAIFLGWERFWLEDVAMGVVKIITGYGCGIWWLIDIASAQSRAKKYNIVKFLQVTSF